MADRPPRPPRTSSDGGHPIRQVVGFHVEGVAASPSPAGLLAADPAAAGGARVSSSPNVVMVPPSFAAAPVRWREGGRGREGRVGGTAIPFCLDADHRPSKTLTGRLRVRPGHGRRDPGAGHWDDVPGTRVIHGGRRAASGRDADVPGRRFTRRDGRARPFRRRPRQRGPAPPARPALPPVVGRAVHGCLAPGGGGMARARRQRRRRRRRRLRRPRWRPRSRGACRPTRLRAAPRPARRRMGANPVVATHPPPPRAGALHRRRGRNGPRKAAGVPRPRRPRRCAVAAAARRPRGAAAVPPPPPAQKRSAGVVVVVTAPPQTPPPPRPAPPPPTRFLRTCPRFGA